MRRWFGLPLAVSTAGHGCVLALLILLVGQVMPVPKPQTKPGIEIVLAPSEPVALSPPTPEATPIPPMTPPPVVETTPPIPEPSPPPVVEATPPTPPPEPFPRPVPKVVAKPPPPRRPPQPVHEQPPRPPVAQPPPAAASPPPQPVQTAAVPRPVTPPPAPAGPIVSAGYRAALNAWLQGHRQYPESARASGEQGQVLLRFRVERSGHVLDYAVVRSSGYADLDAAVSAMMQGAVLPPFPADMTAANIEVTVAVRFALTR